MSLHIPLSTLFTLRAPAYAPMSTQTHKKRERKEGGGEAREREGAKEMAQWLEALAALQKDLDAVSHAHISQLTTTMTPAPGDLMPSAGPSWACP